MYRVNGKLELAKDNMEQAIRIIDEYGLAYYHDSIVQLTNYAVLLTDIGQPDAGLSALRKLCRVIREYNSDTGLDYASVQEAMGGICLTKGEIQQATYRTGTKQLIQLELGERYSAWLTLNPSYSPEQYIFKWSLQGGRIVGAGSRLDVEITEDMVGERCAIYCTIKSTKSWHRYNGYDQQFAIIFQVLPPEE